MNDRRPPTWSARRRRQRRQHATTGPKPARDGGWHDPSAIPPPIAPEPLASREEAGTRRGPYEASYEIADGYDAERRLRDQ
jgi:hypothetical protein